jgi:hypothetical protein
MRSIAILSLSVVFSAGALAQHRGWGGARGRFPGSFPAIGGTLPVTGTLPGDFPALGGTLPIVSPFSSPSTFAQRLGATISGFPGYSGQPFVSRSGTRGFRGRGYAGYAPLYPVFMGGYNTDYVPPEAPDVTLVQPPPPAAPPVIINQNFGPAKPTEAPQIQSYTAPSAERPAPPEDQTLFFIALKDNSVYTAVAYWVENGTLNYVTPQGRHNQVSLALVDRETTARLNAGSRYQLHLPSAG